MEKSDTVLTTGLLTMSLLKTLFPYLTLTNVFCVLEGTQFFSTLDMTSGNYQIELDESDKNKTAFTTKYGLFQYCRMLFGLCNAPATFQRTMNLILRGLTGEKVLAYLDDVIIIGKDFDDTMGTLGKVLERFRQNNLKLKAAKCLLFQEHVVFLGKLICRIGIKPNPSSIEVVRNWLTPASRKDVEK